MYLFELLYQYFDEIYLSASLSGNYEYLNFSKTSTTLLMIVGGICLGMFFASVFAVYQKKHVGKVVRALLSAKAHDKESAKSLSDLGLSKSGVTKHALSTASPVRKLLTVVDEDEVFSYLDELAAAFPEYAAEIKAKKEAAESAETVAETEATEAHSAELAKEPNGEEKTEKDEKGEEGKTSKLKNFFFEKRFRLRKLNFDTVKFFIPEELRYRAEFRFQEKGNSWWGVLIAFVALVAVFLLCLRFVPVFVNMLDAAIVNVAGHRYG